MVICPGSSPFKGSVYTPSQGFANIPGCLREKSALTGLAALFIVNISYIWYNVYRKRNYVYRE